MVIAFVVGIIAYAFYRQGKIKRISFISLPIFVFYLSFVLTITIISREITLNPQYILVLFWSYRAFANGETGIISQVFWNVVLFIPIGTLLMLIFSYKYKGIVSVTIGFLLSSTIEIIQLVSHRGLFEFDDIVHNTFGAVIGIALYLFVSSIVKRLDRKRED